MNHAPIYLAGIERSGTSLMYALLASHPNIAMTRRTNLWTYFNNQYGNLNNAENLQRCLSIMSQYKRLRAIQIDTERVRREFYQGEIFAMAGGTGEHSLITANVNGALWKRLVGKPCAVYGKNRAAIHCAPTPPFSFL